MLLACKKSQVSDNVAQPARNYFSWEICWGKLKWDSLLLFFQENLPWSPQSPGLFSWGYRCLQNIVSLRKWLATHGPCDGESWLDSFWFSPGLVHKSLEKSIWNVGKIRTNPLSVGYFMCFQDCVTVCPKNKGVKKREGVAYMLKNKSSYFLISLLPLLTLGAMWVSFIFGLPYSRIHSCYRFASFIPHLYVLSTAN